MLKRSVIISIFASILNILCLCFFISCEIGLGESVDTEPPSIVIKSPYADSIIRDSFLISGSWTDDGTIDSLFVELTKTDSEEEAVTVQGNVEEIERGSGIWHAQINPFGEDGATILKDGMYQAKVTIKDTAGRTTIQNTSFSIDNTAPVIVLTRPSTGINSTSSDTYGQTFTLEGQAADTNNVSLIEVYIYSDSECTDLLDKVELPKVPNTINMDVAEFQAGNTENHYFKIYKETTTDGGAKDYYCKIIAYDYSKRYPVDGSEQSESDKKGNSTGYYYLYNDIATEILQDYKITEVYSILSGNFSETSADRKVKSNALENLLASYKNSIGKFTLNPKNNPTFTVSGRNPLVKNPETGLFMFNNTEDISNGGKLVIEVSPGLDGYILNKDSLCVYAQSYSNSQGLLPAKRINFKTEEVQIAGSSYKIVAQVSVEQGFEIGTNYIIGVDGFDEGPAHNTIEPSAAGYGFHMSTSGKAPTILVSSPVNTNTYVSRYGTVDFAGTVSVEYGKPELSLSYVGKDGNQVNLPLTLKRVNSSSDYVYSFSQSINASETFAAASAQIPFKIIALQDKEETVVEKNIVYDFFPPKINMLNTSPYVDKIKKYDSQGQCDENRYLNGSVAFKVAIVDDDDIVAENGAEYLVYDESGNLLKEEIIESPTQALFTIDTEEKKADGSPLYPDGTKITLKLKARDRSGNEIIKDRENDDDVWTYIVDQTTDLPRVFAEDESVHFDVKDFDAITTKPSRLPSGNKFTLKLYDDDGPVTVKIRYTKNPVSDTDPTNNIAAVINDADKWEEYSETIDTDSNYDKFYVRNTGYYLYQIIVEDNHGKKNSDYYISEEDQDLAHTPFLLKVTKSAVSIDNVEQNDFFVNKNMTVSNAVKIGLSEGPYTITETIKTESPLLNVESQITVFNNISDNEFTSGKEITYKADKLYSGKNKIEYVVEDAEDWKSSAKTIYITRDDDGPSNLDITAPSGNMITSDSYKFEGRVSDSSGINAVYYQFVKEGGAEPDAVSYGENGRAALDEANWTALNYTPAALSDTGWYMLQEFIEGKEDSSPKLSEGLDYTLYVYAVDKAGNTSNLAAKTFDVDLKKPEIKSVNGLKNIYLNSDADSGTGSFTLTVDAEDSLGVDCLYVSYDDATRANPILLVKDDDGKYKKQFVFGAAASASVDQVKLPDGSYTFKVTANDKVGKTDEKEVSFIIDTKLPELTGLNINGSDYDKNRWFDSQAVSVNVNASDSAGSSGSATGVASVEYSTDSENGQIWTALAPQANGAYHGTVTFGGAGTRTLYLRVKDKAGNINYYKSGEDTALKVQIDTSDPDFTVDSDSQNQSVESVAFINDTLTQLTYKGIYKDEQSGVMALTVKLGSLSAEVTYPESNSTWQATFTFDSDSDSSNSIASIFGDNEYLTLEISGSNKAGRPIPVVTRRVCRDNTAPLLSNINISSQTGNGLYRNESNDTTATYFVNADNAVSLTLSGNTSDKNGIKEITCSESTETKSSEVWSWPITAPSSETEPKTITVSAFDKAGNFSTYSITLNLDTTAPVTSHEFDSSEDPKDLYFRIGNVDNEDCTDESLDKDVGEKYSLKTYGNDTSIEIRGLVEDTSGSGVKEIFYKIYNTSQNTRDEETLKNEVINSANGSFALRSSSTKRVFYTKDDGSTDSKTITTNFREKLTGFSEGNNFMVLVAVDHVGNSSLDKYTIKEVSTDVNYLNYSINIDRTPPSLTSDIKETSYTNAAAGKKIILSGEVSDKGGSDVDRVVILHPKENDENGDPIEIEAILSKNSTPYKWSYSLDATTLADASGSTPIYAKAYDKAGSGNWTKIEAARVIVDTVAPEITLEAPVDADESASAPGVQVNGVIRLMGTSSDKIGDVPNNKFTVEKLQYKMIKDASGLSVSNDDWHDVDETLMGSNYRIVSSENFTVLNFDTTKLENLASYQLQALVKDYAENETWSAPVTFIVDQDTDRPVITVTSPSSIDMSSGSATWENGTINGTVSDDDGSVSIAYYIGDSISNTTSYTPITISNGIWKIENLEDGTNKIFFKVTVGDKVYLANTDGVYDEHTYKLTDGSHNYGYYNSDTPAQTSSNVLSLVIDTVAPAVENPEYSVDGGNEWKTGIGNQLFGGTKNNSFKIRQSGWDKNVVKSMTVRVIEVVNGIDKAEKYSAPAITEPNQEISKGDKTYLLFTSDEISGIGNWKSTGLNADGNTYAYRLEIEMSDGIKPTITKIDLTIDNTPPDITFRSPAENSINSGEITVYGTSNETSTLSYTVSTDGVHAPTTNAGKTLSTWTGYTVAADGSKTPASGSIANVSVPEYKTIPDTNVSWYVYFDGNQTDSEHAHESYLKYFAEELGITEDVSEFEKLINFYIWIKAEDQVGNVKEYPYLICLDPQGDRPIVTLSNPEKDNDSLGGTVKLYGTAEDSNGTIESVWVQLLSARNGSYISSFTPTASDLQFWHDHGYTVEKMKPDANGVHTPWTSSVTNEEAPAYGIKANFSGTAWNLKINEHGEFDPENSANEQNEMAVRVYSCDNNYNLSYSVTRNFKMDKDSPVISEVVLKQYAADDINCTAPLASQEVRSGMYVKGKWYLEFTVKDNGNINEIAYDDIPFPSENITDKTPSSGVEKFVRYALPTDSVGIGVFKHTIKATDNTNHTGIYDVEIKWDNEAPRLLNGDYYTDFDIPSSVRQNNGFYRLKSKVSDAYSNSGTPSGVKAVGFYFMRRKSASEGLIYDTVQRLAAPLSTNELDYSEGLYWMKGKINCDASGSITLGEGLAGKAAYVHAGSYIKLGGVMYKITTVSGNTLTIEESFDTSLNKAYIALAQFVDNRKSEYEASKEKNAQGYYTSIKNDDSDNMIEELGGTSGVSSWQASIVSRNIPDGPIEIHYTAFDEAMNYAVGVVGNKSQEDYENYSTPEVNEIKGQTAQISGTFASYVYSYKSENPAYISNNAPRLAGVTVAIDYTGTGNYNEETSTTYYYQQGTILINDTAVKKAVAVTDNLIVSDKVKDASGNVIGHKAVNTIKGKTWIIPEMVGGNGKLWYTYNIYDSDSNGSKTETLKKSGGTNALYFADGNNDYDDYEKEAGYIEYHSTTKNGAFAAIEHEPEIFTTTGDTPSDHPFWFDYTIYDSTEIASDDDRFTGDSVEASLLENNQKTRISIAMAVEVNDGIAPTIEISPLYWKSATDNSLYRDENGNRLGHVELKSDIAGSALATKYGDDDKVSGIVVFSGYAYDNKCLSKLEWGLKKDDNWIFPASEAVMQVGATFNKTNSSWTNSSNLTTNHYSFQVSTAESDGAYHNKDGHRVKWTLTLDTSYIAGLVAEDVSLIVKATDTSTGSSGNLTCEDSYQVDILPYVTGITTSLTSLKKNNPSIYNRSALGHYPVRIGETVSFEGFNLGDSKTLPITDSMTSSEYQFKVGEIEAVNNLNNNDAKGQYQGSVNLATNPSGIKSVYDNYYNRQPNGDNNNLLTDDIYFDVWEFHSDAAIPISGKIEQPVMKINPVTGQLGFAFVNGPLYFSMGGLSEHDVTSADYHGETSYDYWMGSFDFFTSVGFTYDSLGYSYGVAAGGDINSSAADKFQLMTSRWGHASRSQYGSYCGLNAIDTSRPSAASLKLESIGIKGTKADTSSKTYNFDKQRIKSPSFATSVHGSGDDAVTNLYLAYYDAMNDEIRFKAGDSDHFNSFDVTITESEKYYQITSFDNEGDENQNLYAHYDSTSTGKLSNNTFVTLYKSDKSTPINSGKIYKVTGTGNSGKSNCWFRLEEVNNLDAYKTNYNETLKSTSLEYYPAAEDLDDVESALGTYVRVCNISKKISNSSFIDYDVSNGLYSYRNATVSMLAGSTTNTGHNAGEYLSIGVVPGTTATNDVVVACWYDQTDRVLRYAYNTSPMTNRNGTTDGLGWTYAANPVFSGEMENAGEYCQLVVDAKGGIHIAAYDPVNCDLVYAYLSKYNSTPQTCVVDSSGVVGSNITIDVALTESGANGKPVPRIGYYATSCVRPKIAYLADTSSQNPAGADDEAFTGKWESSVIPTGSNVTLQSNQYNKMNVAVWKNSAGVITRADDATVFSDSGKTSAANNEKTNTPNGYDSTSYGFVYGNGSANAVMGYAIKVDSATDAIETAQLR